MLRSAKNTVSKVASASQEAFKISEKTQHWIDMDEKYVARYYKNPPVVFDKGERIYLYDIDGKKYYDMMGGVAACSQGHCHPRIRDTIIE